MREDVLDQDKQGGTVKRCALPLCLAGIFLFSKS